MGEEKLEQQVARIAEQQVKLGEDLIRIKEQMDHLTSIVVDISERLDRRGGRAGESAEELDEEVVEELTEGINQVAENVDQVADVMLSLANIAQEHHKHIQGLIEADTELAQRIGGVYERFLRLFKMLTENFEAQALMLEAQSPNDEQ